jgi:hypothetical protein
MKILVSRYYEMELPIHKDPSEEERQTIHDLIGALNQDGAEIVKGTREMFGDLAIALVIASDGGNYTDIVSQSGWNVINTDGSYELPYTRAPAGDYELPHTTT